MKCRLFKFTKIQLMQLGCKCMKSELKILSFKGLPGLILQLFKKPLMP